MKCKDREGNFISNSTREDAIIYKLYHTLYGRFIIRILVCPTISKIAGAFLNTRASRYFIHSFIKKNKIDMSCYEQREYLSYNDFFTRKIKPEKRPVCENPKTLISPCDGKAMVYSIDALSKFNIKHAVYTVRSLLKSQKLSKEYIGGTCVILRLSVDDYHRYIYFDHGRKGKNYRIHGRLHTVNPIAVEQVDVYKENSRELTILHTENFGDVVFMEVGAMLVGKIKNHHQKHIFKRGEEKGYFEFGGSTIILMFKKNSVVIDEDIVANSKKDIETKVKCGEKIGISLL